MKFTQHSIPHRFQRRETGAIRKKIVGSCCCCPNIVGSCYVRLHVAKSLTGFKLCATTPNNTRQGATICNGVCKRTQHVTSNMLGVVSQQCCVSLWTQHCCPNTRNMVIVGFYMLRSFAHPAGCCCKC